MTPLHPLLWLALACTAPETPVAEAPARVPETDARTIAPATWSLATGSALERTPEGGLVLRSAEGEPRILAGEVLADPALSDDRRHAAWVRLVGGGPEGFVDVLVVRDDGRAAPRRLTGGVVDRLAMAPDGSAVAYVRSEGLPQVVIHPVDGEPRALTNVDLTPATGQAPEGFVPPPHEGPLRFDGDALVWEAPDGPHRVAWR